MATGWQWSCACRRRPSPRACLRIFHPRLLRIARTSSSPTTGTPSASRGSLTVIGTGIRAALHLTPESRACIERADECFHLAADPVTTAWLMEIAPGSRSFVDMYDPDRTRLETYELIVEEILAAVRSGRDVCAAFYGHPGVFVYPGHEAIRRARLGGFPATMLPAVSAEDCLFCDLGLDPGANGCQSYDATDFLVNRRRFDASAALILWQVTAIGERGHTTSPNLRTFRVLIEYLARFYADDHEVTLYEASPFPVGGPAVIRVPLSLAAGAELPRHASLYVPPQEPPTPDPEMLALLGLAR